jgi:hypothetical protein
LVGGAIDHVRCCHPARGAGKPFDGRGLCPRCARRLDQEWSNPHRITIEATEAAAAEIERRFGSVLLIEPELVAGDPEFKRQMTLAEEIMLEDRDILRALAK